MSERYRDSKDIPNSVLADRLDALSGAVTKGREAVAREFTMRVPAERDRDADLVLSEAADRIRRIDAETKRLREIAECNDPGAVGLRPGEALATHEHNEGES